MPRGRRAAYWVVALLPFLLVLAHNWGPAPPGDATDAYHYLLHGRALAEGSGYANTGYIFTPLNPWIGPRMQPPGMALLLYPVFEFLGASVPLMRFIVLLWALAFFLLAGWSFAQRDGFHLGLSVTLLVGLIPAVAVFATHVYSDLVSAAALWAVICVVDSERPFDGRKLALILAFGTVALITRLSGVALLGALVLFALVRYRDFGLRPLVPVAIWIAGGLVAWLAVDAVIPVWALDGFRGISQWIATLQTYRFGFFEMMLYPFRVNLANDVYHVVALGIMVLGLGEWLRRGWNRFATCFVLVYALMIVYLPVNGMGRYLWPVAPLVLFGMMNGVRTLLRILVPRLAPARLDAAVLATAVVLALLSTVSLVSSPRSPSLIEDPTIQEVVQYVRNMEEAEDARVAFEHPRLLTWETRVPAMGLPRRPDRVPVEALIEEFRAKRITHVISLTGDPDSPGEQVLRLVMQSSPTMFALLDRGPGFAVYVIQ